MSERVAASITRRRAGLTGRLGDSLRWGEAAETLEQADGYGVAGLLTGELADLGLDGELVGAVAEGHERAAERMAARFSHPT